MTDTKKQQHSRIPVFKNRQELAEFWDTHDIADYVDELKPVTINFDLEKTQEDTVVLRLQHEAKEKMKQVAATKGLTLSSLMRMWLLEKLQSAQA